VSDAAQPKPTDGIIDGEADDNDPKVIEGMRRLEVHRAIEGDVPEGRF